MVKMNFSDPVLEKLIRRWKWTRNNTLELFQKSEEQNMLLFRPYAHKEIHHNLLYQFQCIVTTTDTYYRKITNSDNLNFGLIVLQGEIIPKKELSPVAV